MQTKNILFVGSLIGTGEMPNGICSRAVIRELKNRGHNVWFLAQNNGYLPNEEIVDDFYVRRVCPTAIGKLHAWHIRHHSPAANLLYQIMLFVKNIFALCFLWVWPFQAPINAWQTYHAAKSMIRTYEIDTLICLYSPFNAILVGHFLKNRFPNIKYGVYFLDSLSGGARPKLTSQEWVKRRGLKWERILLSNADAIYIMKAHEKHHYENSSNEAYFSRMKVLDIPLIQSYIIQNTEKTFADLSDDKINMVYLGSLSRKLKDPRYLIELFLAANHPNAVLTFIGNPGDCQAYLESACRKYPDRICIRKSVPHEQVASILNQANVLVNIGSANACQIPCKIFEYISTGKPILSTYSIEDEPSIPYLKKYKNAVLFQETECIAPLDVDRLNLLLNHLPETIQAENLEQEYYLCSPAAFSNAIEKL